MKRKNIVQCHLRDLAIKQKILHADVRFRGFPVVDYRFAHAENLCEFGAADISIDIPIVAGFALRGLVVAPIGTFFELTANVSSQSDVFIAQPKQIITGRFPIYKFTYDFHEYYYSIICKAAQVF